MGAFEDLCVLLEVGGGAHYGESVSVADHLLLAAEAARRAGLRPQLVASALLHDVGHLLEDADDWAGVHDHARTGGDWVESRFGAAVAQPVRLHVEAKRYLCGTDPTYQERLSDASRHTLTRQGGALDPDGQRAFRLQDGWDDAVVLRRLEDSLGKRADAEVPPLESFRELLRAQSRMSGAGEGPPPPCR